MISPLDKAAQCARNIRAVLRYYGLPNITIVRSEEDRVWATVPATFEPKLISTRAFEMWNCVSNHNQPGCRALRGWREEVSRESMQVIEYETGEWGFDIDHWNPGYGDVVSFFGHFGEIIIRGKTDPFAVAKGLKKRGVIA